MRTMQGILLSALLLPALVTAAPAGWQPLLEPAELAEILAATDNVRPVRVTGNYRRGHLPGSVASPYEDWRGTGRNPGQLRELSDYTALLQQLGISRDSPVVVVHEGTDAADMGAATRVYWTLKTLGIADVAVINGGYRGWVDAGLPVSTDEVTVPASHYQPAWHNQWRVTTAEVEALVEAGEGNLIDARPLGFYRGLRATLGRPGTIRGAVNLEYTSWFDDSRLMAADRLTAAMTDVRPPDTAITVSFCNTGHWASINWFVMSELLGRENTRLYAESVAEWSAAERPMDNQAGRLEIYRDLTLRWFQDLFGNRP